MQSSPHNLNKTLPIPNGGPVSSRTFDNHNTHGNNDVRGQGTTRINKTSSSGSSGSSLFAKFNLLNPVRSQPPTSSRGDSSSPPFRIVHTRDRTPLYVPLRQKAPKANFECCEALEEMHAVSQNQQQQQRCDIGEDGGNARTRLQMHPSDGGDDHHYQRYVSIMQDSSNNTCGDESRDEEMIWVRMRLGDLNKKTILKVTDSEDSSYQGSSSDGTGAGGHNHSRMRRPRAPPPPPLPLSRDTRSKSITNMTSRSMMIMPPGRLHMPPPPSSPRSAGPALETIPASPLSPSTSMTTPFDWLNGPASAGLPSISTRTTILSPSRRNMSGVGGSREHKRIASTDSQPLRAPRPLSERPFIPLGSCGYSPSLKDGMISTQRRMTATTAKKEMKRPAASSPLSSPVIISQDVDATSSTLKPNTGRSISKNFQGESPIELREYEDLTTRRSRPRIPMSNMMEGPYETKSNSQASENGEEVGSIKGSTHHNDGENWSGSGSGSENNTPAVIPTQKRHGISILVSATPENRCFLCTTPIAADMELCGGDCSALRGIHSPEEEQIEYSDSEYYESSVRRRTLSPNMIGNMKFPPSPITPTRPLRCGGGEGGGDGGDGDVDITPTMPIKSPRRQLDRSPAVSMPSTEGNMAVSIGTTGWSCVSSSNGQPNTTHLRTSPTRPAFSTAKPSTPSLSTIGAQYPGCFSPPYSPGLRKGSASSATSSYGSSSSLALSGPNEPSSALFHLERSIKNDPSWSPLIPGASPVSLTLAAGHEFLRWGRVPSGEGHQVVVVRADSANCSSHESSSVGEDEEEVEKREQKGESSEDEIGVAVSSSKGCDRSVMEPASLKEEVKSTVKGANSHGNYDEGYYKDKDKDEDNNHQTEKREAGGSYGDWFSYYAEETRQKNAALAAQYVHHLFPTTFLSPIVYGHDPDFSDPEDESGVSPITSCELFSDRIMGDRHRMMSEVAEGEQRDKEGGGEEEEEKEERNEKRPFGVTNVLTMTTTTKKSTTERTRSVVRRRRSSIYARIQSIYDAYADISGEEEDWKGEEASRENFGRVGI